MNRPSLHVLLASALLLAPVTAAVAADPIAQRVEKVLRATPLIDGHNDLPWALRDDHGSRVEQIDLAQGTDRLTPPLMTDLARMRQGMIGAQFWSVYIPVSYTGDAAIRATLEQIDVTRRIVARYPAQLVMVGTASELTAAHKRGRIASLLGIEGAHQIGESLAALRQFHALGARYMTLTHTKGNEVADSATDAPRHDGLSAFGRTVVGEMNRLGMLVDISHVSAKAMRDVLAVTRAPVLFTHSNAFTLTPHPRNVPDDVLRQMPANGGVVMVTFVPSYASNAVREWSIAHDVEQKRLELVHLGDDRAVAPALKAWEAANPVPAVGIRDVADHVDYVARVAGKDHVGIGGDLDGISMTIPGLDNASTYPALFAELARRGWSDGDLAKLAGGNVLRAMTRAEAVAAAMAGTPPANATP